MLPRRIINIYLYLLNSITDKDKENISLVSSLAVFTTNYSDV